MSALNMEMLSSDAQWFVRTDVIIRAPKDPLLSLLTVTVPLRIDP